MARTTIRTEDITASEVTTAKMATDPTNASNLASGTVGTARMGSGTASSSTILYGDGTWKAEPETDTSTLENEIAILAFKTQANGNLARYNLIDQSVDSYEDASGIDAGASTNETRSSGGKYYSGVAGTSSTSKTFSYTGANESWTIPSSTTSLTIKAWGAGGGGGGYNGGGAGGSAYATGIFAVDAGITLIGVVGGGGKYGGADGSLPGPGTTGAFGGGGPSTGQSYTDANGGNGGGYSGLFISSVSQANAIIVAGGGGGGGYAGTNGGYGGGTTGGTGENGGGTGGTGGGQSSGGTAGTGATGSTNGAALQGGTGGNTSQPYYCAGGGGGWYGGGGAGGSNGGGSSGSGGGSSNVRVSDFPSGVNSVSSNSVADGTIGSGTTGGAEAESGQAQASGKGGNQKVSGENGTIYVTYDYSPADDMTLISNAVTADSPPTKGDIVVAYSNGAGTATVGTDLKVYMSRDGSAYTSAISMTSVGTSGGQIMLTANDIDLSGITSGTSIKYKIETLNQSAAKDTRIHGVSLGWS